MNKLGILAILLVFFGEALAIYSEVWAAKHGVIGGKPIPLIVACMFLLITLSGAFLILGYVYGIIGFKDIWIVSVVSVTSIIIVEPIVNYALFRQLPGIGPAIGFILGIAGLIVAIFIP